MVDVKDVSEFLQKPTEELVKLVGLTDEDIMYLDDDELNGLCDELSNSKNIRLRLKLRLYKNKLREKANLPTIEKIPSKPLTVTQTVDKYKVLDDKKNQFLQIPMEKLLEVLGTSDEGITDIEDNLLYQTCDELSGGENFRLRVRVKQYKSKLIQQKEDNKQILTQEEQEREHQRQLEKDRLAYQKKKEDDEYRRKTFASCSYCGQRTIHVKTLVKNAQARCENPSCRKIVDYCSTCRGMSKIEDEHVCPEDMIKYLDTKERYEQQEQRQREENALKQQEEMLKQQEEISKQQIKEQLIKQPIRYGTPDLTETILESKFAQAGLSRSSETIETLSKTIGKKKTEQLADAIISRVK